MKLLVTGGAGFIGSNFIRHMLLAHGDVQIVNLDALTYAGNIENLVGIDRDPRYAYVRGDIAEADSVEGVFTAHRFDAVVNFAAESHVDRSLHLGVDAFIRTNIQGTQRLLDAARAHGVPRFLQVSTDEVYGSLGAQGRFTEASPVLPNNPYAATKAAADFLVRAAHRSHGIDAVITRCSNNYGPYQFPEKLIPLMIANAREDKPLPVYGDGLHVRDWIFVLDHCEAIDVVLRKAAPGKVYNVGGDHDVPNIDIVRGILALVGKDASLIRYVADRPGHDRRYAMDSSLIRAELGWTPRHSFDQALAATVRWYTENAAWLDHVRSGAYLSFYDSLYSRRLAAVDAG